MNKILFKLIEGKGKFFLMRDVPKIEKDLYGDSWPYQTKKYVESLESCISEALKNGEIVNPELILDAHLIKTTLVEWGHYPLKDGDTFDLPEGMGFEREHWTNGPLKFRLLPDKPVQKEEPKPIRSPMQAYNTGYEKGKIEGFNEAIEEVKKRLWIDRHETRIVVAELIDELSMLKK